MTTFQNMAECYSGRYRYKLKKISETLFQAFDFSYFFYISISPERHCTFIGTNPDLIQHYWDEKMHYCNPFFVNTQDVKSGLYLYDSVQNSDFQTSMQRMEIKYKAKHCALLTRNDHRGCVLYGFATKPQISRHETFIFNQVSLLQNFTHYFENDMKSVLQNMAEQPVDLRSQLDVFAKSKELILPKISLDKDKAEAFLKEYSDKSMPHFTAREKDVIKVFLKGKTAREIADDLSLSLRTVQHYIENIKNKLHCTTKSELFASLQNFSAKADV